MLVAVGDHVIVEPTDGHQAASIFLSCGLRYGGPDGQQSSSGQGRHNRNVDGEGGATIGGSAMSPVPAAVVDVASAGCSTRRHTLNDGTRRIAGLVVVRGNGRQATLHKMLDSVKIPTRAASTGASGGFTCSGTCGTWRRSADTA